MPEGDWIHLDVEEVVVETDSALLLRLDDGEEYWIPLSQISEADDYEKGDKNVTISVTRWIAEKKRLI